MIYDKYMIYDWMIGVEKQFKYTSCKFVFSFFAEDCARPISEQTNQEDSEAFQAHWNRLVLQLPGFGMQV